MKSISFREANKNLKAVLDTVNDDADLVLIKCEHDKDAVVVSHAYYISLMETLYLLRSPANAAHLAKSIDQYQAGKVK